ncbi:blood vessel epicardial substance-A-like [Onthophagus taurus]|uniref:blood vessel epicardial substance-A-like n=1 Tax=Onthophagus taurus TaxID=166361 RepID=UPI0039BE862F
MEIYMIQSRLHLPEATTIKPKSVVSTTKFPNTTLEKAKRSTTTAKPVLMGSSQDPFFDYGPNVTANYNNFSLLLESNYTLWNNSELSFNLTNDSFVSADYDFRTFNVTTPSPTVGGTCKEWTPAQHNLFQTANFFFAFAFIVPGKFKQSVLLVRALLTLGYVFLTFWAAADVCSPDILLWNLLLVILNLTHTVLLTWRFLPPTLTLELTELYLKVFKPLRVSKKHFKELVREAQVINLERGDIYAVEDVSPADERLSILLKGKLRVTCDDTHLHFITTHQFVDSPEWEANHDQSDDVFQVTITAEDDSVYLCWSRMRLERILRHKPMLKVVLDSIIGKDITQKLYSLNEHLTGLEDDRKRVRHGEIWARAHSRSMSMDAVNTGTTGLVRSTNYKSALRKYSLNSAQDIQFGFQNQCWIPLTAPQFPPTSPFMGSHQPLIHQRQDSTSSSLKPPTPSRTKSFRKAREVKFQGVK